MAYYLPHPVVGMWPWPLSFLPNQFELGGLLFERAFLLVWPESGVIAQYRSSNCEGSWHFKLRADGSYFIDHIDAKNPSCSVRHAVDHVVEDVPNGGAILAGAVISLLAIGVTAAVAGSKKPRRQLRA